MITETKGDTVIGLFNDDTYSFLASLKDLFDESKDSGHRTFGMLYTMKEYGDLRRSTNLVRFNFDPFTGKKIDWNVVKHYKGE